MSPDPARQRYPLRDPALVVQLRAQLRAQIRSIEVGADQAGSVVDGLVLETFAPALPQGLLVRGAVHEMAGDPAATGFVAALAGRLAAQQGSVLWIAREAELYGPGLAAFGLDPGRLIVARARQRADLLAAMEDGLRCSALAAVIGEIPAFDLTSGRRLQLAAAGGRSTGFVLRPLAEAGSSGSMAMTRWRISAAPSAPRVSAGQIGGTSRFGRGLGRVRWRVELIKARGGSPAEWLVEWNDETGDFGVAAEFFDRPHHTLPAAPLADDIVGLRRAG